MKQLTEILTGVWVIEVEADANTFSHGIGNKFFYQTNMKNEILRIGFDFEYLGYCTKDEISFDVSEILEKKIHKDEPVYYRLYNQPPDENGHIATATTDKDRAFRSLLLKNNLYWANPLGVVPPKQVYSSSPREQEYMDDTTNSDSIKQWREYERNRLTGKLIFIKKVK